MELKLGDIPIIASSLKCGTTQAVKALNTILGFTEFDRNSRKRIRKFVAFPNDFDLEKHKEKLLNDLSLTEFISAANLLHLEIEANAEILCDSIFKALSNISEFQKTLNAEFSSEDENEITDTVNSPSKVGQSTSFFPTHKESLATKVQGLSLDSSQIYSSPFRRLNNADQTSFSNEMTNSEMNTQFWYLLRDISANCRKFSGDDFYTIKNFFRDIEENFDLFPSINDSQKLIFAKRLICGTAKSFLFSQSNLNTYEVFKTELIKEFSDTVTSIEIHRELQNRKMSKTETFLQYLNSMRELANRCDTPIDEASVIQYVINGIPGAQSDKIILYGANSFSEFKQKLRTYETIVNDVKASNSVASNLRNNYDKQKRFVDQNNQRKQSKFNIADQSRTLQRCFNCNDVGHLSKSCPNRSRGPKCLSCNMFGHKSLDCSKNKRNDSSNQNASVNTVLEKRSPVDMCKEVIICDRKFNGLTDTGSNLTLLRKSAHVNIGSPPLEKSNKLLTGFGFSQTNIVGSFESELIIDEQNFPVTINVVPNTCTHYDLIIGCDVIQQANLSISQNGVKFSKISETSNNIAENFILNIADDSPTFDIGPNVSKQTRVEVEQLLMAYKPEKTKTANVELDIVLTDDEPIFHKPRRLPFTERGIVDEQVDEWLKNGIVEPCSSPYASQVVVVRKKDGKSRVCIDYRRLNRKLIKDNYPLPLIDDILDCLQNAKIFITIDLKNGFFHVPVNEKSRKYTSFITHNGQYQFRRMPFGISNGPSIFMRYINSVFRDLIAKGIVLPYLDDIVIPAANESEALEYFKLVLEVARNYGLEINFKKCQFLHNRIEFLGHVIENGKLSPSPTKTKAVLNYPELKNVKDVRRFLGLTGYFRKFIPSYSTIAKPLSDLLRKDSPFIFQTDQKNAFQKLKYLLSQQPVLSIFNQNSPIEIHSDASIDGLGAVLLQKSMTDNQLHPVFYMSKKTSDNERKFTSFELEVLAVVEALKKFRIYVLGKEFKIVTDCDALVKTLKKKELNSRIARWALYLQEFNYTIEHRSGTKMAHVDALSRAPLCMVVQDSVHLQLLKAQQTDEHIKTIVTLLQTAPHDDYIIKNKLLYKTINGVDLIVVPDEMQANIIKTAHERGHFAVLRTQELVNKDFYIPNLRAKVERCIQNCVTCILVNRKRGKQEGMLHPIDKDDTPLHTYHLDHLGPLATTSKKYKYIFAVIDAFTKFTWLYPTKSTDAAEVINRLENQSYVFGNPVRIITDRGSAFTSTAFKDYCLKQNIVHVAITAGLPRANGQVEKQNSTIISVLSKLSADDPEKWYSHVPHLQQILNSTFQRSIKSTPFELLFGTKIKSPQDQKIMDLLVEEITTQFQQHRDELRKDAKNQICKVQDENKRYYNLRRKPAQKFQINDLVAIKRTQFGPGLKLKQKFLGPYKVVKVKANDTYDVEKTDFVDGPFKTSTCAEFMKPWPDKTDNIN